MPKPRTISADYFSPDTLEFLRLLEKYGVQYVVVGGEAVIFHGYPRLTGDIDFFYGREPSNVRKLYECLREFWSGNVPTIESAADFLEEGTVVQFGQPPHRIDLLNSIDGVDFAEVWQRAERVRIADGTEKVIPLVMMDLESLLKNKKASARPKDVDDVEHLESVPDTRKPCRRAEGK